VGPRRRASIDRAGARDAPRVVVVGRTVGRSNGRSVDMWTSLRESVGACAGYETRALDDGDGTMNVDGDDATTTTTAMRSETDARGRTYVVTGVPESVVAVECARRLRRAGARVVCASADVDAAEEATREEAETTTTTNEDGNGNGGVGSTLGELVVLHMDPERLDTVEGFVEAFCARAWALDGVLNACAATLEPFALTEDEIEKHFAVNHLVGFKLTALLMNELVRTAAAAGREGRVVNVSSNLHHFTYRVRRGTVKPSRGIDFNNLNNAMGYSAMNSYGQSRLANILHAWSLSERMEQSGSPVRCVAVTPGMTQLELERSLDFPGGGLLSGALKPVMISSVEDAAATPLYCLTADTLPEGTYFNNCAPVKSSLPSRDPRLASKLWEFSEEMCGIAPSVPVDPK